MPPGRRVIQGQLLTLSKRASRFYDAVKACLALARLCSSRKNNYEDAFVASFCQSYDRNYSRVSGVVKHCCFNLRSYGLRDRSVPDLTGNFLQFIPHNQRWKLSVMSDRRRRNTALQLSMLARALPPPPCDAQGVPLGAEEAVNQLRNINTVDDGLKLPDKFDLVLERMSLFRPHKKSLALSPGATVERRRKDGGYTACLAEYCKGSSLFSGSRRGDGNIDAITPSKLRRVLDTFPAPINDDGYRSIARPIALPETGNKIRIVTKEPFVKAYNGHLDRKDTFECLLHFRATGIPLKDPTEYVFRIPDDGKTRLVYSADLSNATDYLSHDTIKRVCDKLCIPPEDVLSHTYRVGDELVEPVRGTFMGLPPSWIVLSIAHEAICRMVDPAGSSYFLKGDDLAAYWTSRQWEKYQSLMTLAGFKVNLKKSFVSSTRFWFCEKGYQLTQKNKYISSYTGKSRVSLTFQRLNLSSLRYLVKQGGIDDSFISRNTRYLSEYRNYNSRAVKIIRKILLRRSPPALRYLAEYPLQLGGLSLPYRDRNLSNKFILRAMNAVHDGHVRPLTHSRVFSPLGRKALSIVDRWTSGLKFIPHTVDRPMLDVSDAMASLVSHVIQILILRGEFSPPIRGETAFYKARSLFKKRVYAAPISGRRLNKLTLSYVYDILGHETVTIESINELDCPAYVRTILLKDGKEVLPPQSLMKEI